MRDIFAAVIKIALLGSYLYVIMWMLSKTQSISQRATLLIVIIASGYFIRYISPFPISNYLGITAPLAGFVLLIIALDSL